MSKTKTINPLSSRLKLFAYDFSNESVEMKNKFDKLVEEKNGDWGAIRSKLAEDATPELVAKLDFTHQLSNWTRESKPLVRLFQKDQNTNSMRDVALRFNKATLADAIVKSKAELSVEGDTLEAKAAVVAKDLHNQLFHMETSGVLLNMVNDVKLSPVDPKFREGVATVLTKLPEFNIRNTSVYTVLQDPKLLEEVAEDLRQSVVSELKSLQRVQAISPVPEVVPVLMKANMTSAFRVTEMPEKAFVQNFSASFGEGKAGENIAMQVYHQATNTRIRVEQGLIAMREAVQGTGIAFIDKPAMVSGTQNNTVIKDEIANHSNLAESANLKKEVAYKAMTEAAFDNKMAEAKIPLTWEALFGSADFCECGECNSVYSAAAYLVDLLQYLRNNNVQDGKVKADPKDISGTPLDMLFRRRPDLGCLELTCKNINTVLPYIDLVNEVLESFVVHLSAYKASATNPKQTKLDIFNVEGETTGELLAQPQHTNYYAYCILKKEVYPFQLPYHQPIDAIRIFLEYLETSRYEVLKEYQVIDTPPLNLNIPDEDDEDSVGEPAPAANQERLRKLNQKALDRALDAEFLDITEEEYIILTKEKFWTREYINLKTNHNLNEGEYRQKIGVKPVHAYYGYDAEAQMLNSDDGVQQGLTFVKKQFLKRTGIQYTDLVELLKTRYINPNYPEGEALTMMQNVQFSYRFLQSLVDKTSNDPKLRFAKVVELLEKFTALFPFLDAQINPDPCNPQKADWCRDTKWVKKWVYCHFEKLGKLIVLDNGCKCGGRFFNPKMGDLYYAYGIELTPDCTIFLNFRGESTQIGTINCKTGTITYTEGFEGLDGFYLIKDGKTTGIVLDNVLIKTDATDDCNLDTVRLIHLDGTDLIPEEYDRMQRFIRLWLKTSWTIDEVDKAIIGLGAEKIDLGIEELTNEEDCIDCDDCEDCEDCPDREDCHENQPKAIYNYDISPKLIRQLAAVKKLLDLTGLELIKLLTFWTDISTTGEKSLYKRLFLAHNLLGIDKVFQANASGNFLTKPAKITEHLPVLMAAFNLKAEDIEALMTFKLIQKDGTEKSLINGDELTLANISAFYRYRLLAQTISVKMPDLLKIIPLLGDPFTGARKTVQFLENWGKIEDAGFTFKQLNYIIRSYDDLLKPLASTQRSVLQLAKTLYDGLRVIDTAHPDLKNEDEASLELVRSKLALLYEPAVVESVAGLLEGANIYSTNALVEPENTPPEQKIVLPEKLAKKIKYDRSKGAIQITGILTEAEMTAAKALSDKAEWDKAFDRTTKQALYLFNDVLTGGIFADIEVAKETLLRGDVAKLLEEIPEGESDPNTAPKKRVFFLKNFLPFLRQRLTHHFIVDTLAGIAGLEREATDVLVSEILRHGDPAAPIYNIFKAVKQAPAAGAMGWKGYLIPGASENYTFIATLPTDDDASDDLPPVVSVDGKLLVFHQQEDPTNEWRSEPISLQSGKLYPFEVTGLDSSLKELNWKTPASAKSAIPGSALLPNYVEEGTSTALTQLHKTAILVKGFNLSADELRYFAANALDFDGLDFNKLEFKHWLRLHHYTQLRQSLQETKTNLLEFFAWANQPDDPAKLSEHIEALTLWKKETVDKLIATEHFNLINPADFKNEINLRKLQRAIKVADKIGMDVNLMFDWAKPTSKFKKTNKIAEAIRKAIRAKYRQEDWEQVVKPLNDKLRGNMRNALVNYLLVQEPLLEWGVRDADSLFEFFLIDVQMDSCMETSRIKQAISSVQLFIQRCFLGLEDPHVPAGSLDRPRWEWMQRYRVWEANRKVFLYPENWIESNLRDDKSPFFKELESELLQKDINKQNVTDALKSYLYKVDEVANMEVVGLFIEDETYDGKQVNKLHIFSRTRNAPYFFYYRCYDLLENNWYPWEKMQVDIPSYDVENANGTIIDSGTFLVPVVWNGRLLIFFPQIMKKTRPAGNGDTAIKTIADGTPNSNMPTEYFEIKMGWSEYRNGKWTQKQLSKDAIATNTKDAYHDIPVFKFIPFVLPDAVLISFDDYLDHTNPDQWFFNAFRFEGSKIVVNGAAKHANAPIPINYFNKANTNSLQTWQHHGNDRVNDTLEFNDLSTRTEIIDLQGETIDFYHPDTHQLLGILNRNQVENLFRYNLALTDSDNALGKFQSVYHELKRPFALYNWELFFHTPMLLADSLSKSQQFEEAMKWYHFVFNPFSDDGNDEKRFWRFLPFKETDAQHVLESIFNKLAPNTPNDEITEWRNHPFMPHLVARGRPASYMKWVVMKYLDNLIAWGDYLFRQDTIESINQATQLYILAGHILGPKPQMIPRRGKIKPETYNSLLGRWDAFSNTVVEMELAFPYSSQTALPVGLIGNKEVAMANIFGFSTTLYFCIPNNPKLLGYWNTIGERLFNIRHCLNIEGVFRKLPLFEPPIDPGLLVKAAAQGLSISSVLNDLNTPMPNYRFYYLLQKSLELCGELKSLGGAMLSAIEKKDNEAIALMRAKHESKMHNLVMEIKKQQLEEAQKSLETLQQNRKVPEHRMKYYLQLIGEDTGKVPGLDSDFSELANAIEMPVDESGLKLIKYEKEDMDKAAEAQSKQLAAALPEKIASIMHIIPGFSAKFSPLGVGGGISFGGSNLGSAAQAWAKFLQLDANELTYSSSSAGKKGGFLRALQDRVMQANAAGYEIKQIDKQITAQQIRINIANLEINNQQQQIDNANEVEEFLRSKYTNEELYTWMSGSLRTLYYQVYSLAYELGKKAEKVFRFERGMSNSNFIQSGYWDLGRDGLLSGEKLYVGLKQLEAAYQEKRGYDYEITKHISLKQLNPLAVIQLKETGTCEFALPEVLFDIDFPGHYMRRIKSVSLSLPCIIGPYTSLNATLRLLENKFRTSSMASSKSDYPEKVDESDERFSTVNIPITAIAASTGQNDSGMFELNFKDERYLPFEGAGAISRWRLELPNDFRQFDYETIADAVIHLRYTSLEGGERLKKAAREAALEFAKSVEELGQQEGLFVMLDLKNDFPTEWHKAMQVAEGDTERMLILTNLNEHLPLFTKFSNGQLRAANKIEASDVVLFAESTLTADKFVLTKGQEEFAFTEAVKVGNSKSFVIRDESIPIVDLKLKIADTQAEVKKLWMVVRFTLS